MRSSRGDLFVGTSGYQYDHWRGVFYPDDLPKKRWFDHYVKHFSAVEINNTFYNLPDPETLETWADRAPEDFCYITKYSRYGSHIKRLKDPQRHVDRFVDRVRRLGPALGPILVQLPPRWNADVDRLAGFLEAAPPDLRWAVEFRDESWLIDDVFDVLREHNAALCVHDLIDDHPRQATADWTYLRFHGPGEDGPYTADYPHQALSAAAARIRDEIDDDRDVYVFFNNDAHGRAVSNASDLKRYVGPGA